MSESSPLARGLARVLPIVAWLPRYQSSQLRQDLAAGLTTAVMLVPQGMAYAMLAGLPPVVGLYASLVPLVAYAALGTARPLAVGPVAMDSLLVAQAVMPMAALGSDDYVGYAVLLAFTVGVLQVMMGILRFGFLVNFLSRPVMTGFTAAAALIISFSQLKHLIGVSLPRSQNPFAVLHEAMVHLEEVNPRTAVVAVASMVLLIVAKKLWPRFPRALAVVVLGTVMVAVLGWDTHGVDVVRRVPEGLPLPAVPRLDVDAAVRLLPAALTIALVAFMEAISVGKYFASRQHYEVDPSQELLAIGAANLAGSFFRAYPVTGGFSRTAVNAQAGATSPMAGVVTAAVVALTLLFLTPLFYYLPKAVLASIIFTAVFGLIDVAEMRRLWRIKRSDLVLLILTFGATLGFGIQQGILVGIAASLVVFVVRTTRPHVAVLGQLPGTQIYRNVKRFPEAMTFPGLLIVRIDAQFYFGNVSFLRETLQRLERAMPEKLKAVVLDASGVNQLDSSAEAALQEIREEYVSRGIKLVLAAAKGPVRDVLVASGLQGRLGDEGTALRVHDAVTRLRSCEGIMRGDRPL